MDKKKLRERKIRARKILAKLKKLFSHVKITMQSGNHWEFLVAVMLSAQCTDAMVNKVTADLFKKYPVLDDYLAVEPPNFEKDIRSIGFYRTKTRNILAAAKKIKYEFCGEIPRTMDELLTIPGVARKTANVVLSNAFGVNVGIAVDTHVKRFVQKFDLSDYADPVRIELDLMEIVPKSKWNVATYGLIEYGRVICPARKHDCVGHPLTKIYPQAAHIWPRAR